MLNSGRTECSGCAVKLCVNIYPFVHDLPHLRPIPVVGLVTDLPDATILSGLQQFQTRPTEHPDTSDIDQTTFERGAEKAYSLGCFGNGKSPWAN